MQYFSTEITEGAEVLLSRIENGRLVEVFGFQYANCSSTQLG